MISGPLMVKNSASDSLAISAEETADGDTYNNHYPRKTTEKRIQLSKRGGRGQNPMQAERKAREKAEKKAAEAAAKAKEEE